MTGKLKGLVAHVRTVAPSAAATHCCIHREQLALKKMPQCLKSVLDESVKTVTRSKVKHWTHVFLKLCVKKWGANTQNSKSSTLKFAGCKVLIRLFELRNKVMLLMHHSDELYDRMHDFQWLAKLAYLADVFSTLNTLTVALQGKTVTVFNVQD